MSDDQGLLEFVTVSVFYVVWHKPNASYYVADISPGMKKIAWTANRSNALYFYTEKEATKHMSYLSKMRSGLEVKIGDIDVIEELDLTELP